MDKGKLELCFWLKPDIMYAGGRNYVVELISEQNAIHWRKSITRAPGIQSAYPSSNVNDINVGYSCGTSNSAALISNKAAECFDVLDRVFISERGEHIPSQYASVLIKAMLVHGASWSGYENVFMSPHFPHHSKTSPVVQKLNI